MTRTQRDADAERTRTHELERFAVWLAGYLAGSTFRLDDVDVELHSTGDGYLPSFAVRRGTLGLVVHVDVELDAADP